MKDGYIFGFFIFAGLVLLVTWPSEDSQYKPKWYQTLIGAGTIISSSSAEASGKWALVTVKMDTGEELLIPLKYPRAYLASDLHYIQGERVFVSLWYYPTIANSSHYHLHALSQEREIE